jgi:hypothetical protein
MTAAEFIQQMLILTGLFFFADENGDLDIVSLDTFATNLNSGTPGSIIDWSKYNVQVLNGSFQFNDNAQQNIIKYKNSDDTLYESQEALLPYDATLEKEKDLYVIQFNLPIRSTTDTVEFILYKQRIESSDMDGVEQISFKNEYDGKDSIVVYDNEGVATINQDILPNDRGTETGFVTDYYGVYKEIIRQPIIREVEVNLDFYTAARIDFKKPVFVEWFGRNCMVLELTALKDEPCVAKLLIIRRDL